MLFINSKEYSPIITDSLQVNVCESNGTLSCNTELTMKTSSALK